MIPNETINDIIHRLDIVDVVQQYVPLTKKGKNFIGICPFHEDNNPSMVVSREKQIFKCFVCGTAGNSIHFLQKYKNISFKEAVYEAAELAGVKLPNRQVEEKDPKMARLLQLNKDFMNYANYMLQSEDGKEGMEYLQDRGYTKELINQKYVGYIPNKENLLYFLENKGYDRQELIDADIITPSEGCKWEKRILFPVITPQGEVRGYTARTIDKSSSQPKYVNTAESESFHKRELLYGGPKAIEEARHRHEIIIVEGSADSDILTQNGYPNCVATLGTALTEEHIRMLKKMNIRIRLCYDGDEAGVKATMKAASLLRKNGIVPLCTSLPYGKDPDELARQKPELLKELLSSHDNTVDFLLKHPSDLSDFQVRKDYAVSVLKELQSYHDPLMKDHYLQQLAKVSRFSITSLHDSYDKMNHSPHNYTAERSQRFAKSEFKEKNTNVRISFREKDKVIYKSEIQQKYDNLRQDDKVTAFDKNKILERTDILRKYMNQKGRLLETTITCVTTDEDIDLRCHAIAESCVKAIGEENHIDVKALEYVAYLHKDTKYPHIHLQVWQDEPLLDRYSLTNVLLEKMKFDVMKTLTSPPPIQETVENIVPDTIKLPGI